MTAQNFMYGKTQCLHAVLSNAVGHFTGNSFTESSIKYLLSLANCCTKKQQQKLKI